MKNPQAQNDGSAVKFQIAIFLTCERKAWKRFSDKCTFKLQGEFRWMIVAAYVGQSSEFEEFEASMGVKI